MYLMIYYNNKEREEKKEKSRRKTNTRRSEKEGYVFCLRHGYYNEDGFAVCLADHIIYT